MSNIDSKRPSRPVSRLRRGIGAPLTPERKLKILEYDMGEYLEGSDAEYFKGHKVIEKALQPGVAALFQELGSVYTHDYVPNEDRVGFSHIILEGKEEQGEMPVVVGQIGKNKKGERVIEEVYFRRQRSEK